MIAVPGSARLIALAIVRTGAPADPLLPSLPLVDTHTYRCGVIAEKMCSIELLNSPNDVPHITLHGNYNHRREQINTDTD
jgi:hypothetical protein